MRIEDYKSWIRICPYQTPGCIITNSYELVDKKVIMGNQKIDIESFYRLASYNNWQFVVEDFLWISPYPNNNKLYISYLKKPVDFPHHNYAGSFQYAMAIKSSSKVIDIINLILNLKYNCAGFKKINQEVEKFLFFI